MLPKINGKTSPLRKSLWQLFGPRGTYRQAPFDSKSGFTAPIFPKSTISVFSKVDKEVKMDTMKVHKVRSRAAHVYPPLPPAGWNKKNAYVLVAWCVPQLVKVPQVNRTLMATVQITDVVSPCKNLGERYTSASDLYSSGSRANSACSSSRRANVIFFRVKGVNNPEESLRPSPVGARRVASGKRCGVSMANRKRVAFAKAVNGSREQLFSVSLGQKYFARART